MKNYYNLLLKCIQHLAIRLFTPCLVPLYSRTCMHHFSMGAVISISALWWTGTPLEQNNISENHPRFAYTVQSGESQEDLPTISMTSSAMMDCNECYEGINLSLLPNCERPITADLLLRNNALALSNPEYYEVTLILGTALLISDNILRIQHVGKKITATVTYIGPGPCPQGLACMTNITLKSNQSVVINESPAIAVYCHDPFLQLDPASSDYEDYRPTVMQSCGGQVNGPFFGGDWVTIHDCVLGEDTAKTIYRQWWAESKDGIRGIAFDTIYVLRLPPLSASNFFCSDKDTVYCGVANQQSGPYIVVPDPMIMSECDTIYLLDTNFQLIPIDSKCGLSVRLDSLVFENTGCVGLTKYTLKVHQNCYGSESPSACDIPPGVSDVVVEGGSGLPLYAICEFWLMELDTLPPVVSCDFSAYPQIDTIDGILTLVVGAGVDCSANFILPDVLAYDACNDVKLIKAMVDTLGVIPYEYDSVAGIWQATGSINLDMRPEPYLIVLESFDACYNVGRDTCAVLVRDLTIPTAVAHQALNLELSGKTGWLDASQINNHSFDNCELNLVLARRVDWVDFWPDFCDSIRFYDAAGPELDTIWCKYVEPDMSVNEFEAYYAGVIFNFATIMNPCGLLLSQAWQYDLCRYATVDCVGSLTEPEFRELYSLIHPETNIDLVSQIGGGWADRVPFGCEDACSEVTVELLVMDYWCNWSTTWTNVLVEDKSLPVVIADVTADITISCTGYDKDSLYILNGSVQLQPLSAVFAAAALGDLQAQAVLDSALGGYQKAWLNGLGQHVDLLGNIIGLQLTLTDGGICECNPDTIPIEYYDLETMQFLVTDSIVLVCETTEESQDLNQGIVEVNCNENSFCQQSISFDLDNCGLGTITRTFKIWKTCGNEIPDTIERVQIITLTSDCELNKYMFDLPADTIIESCAPVFDPLGSGNVVGAAHPDSIGKPDYIFSENCRIIGLAHVDHVLPELESGVECYLILRTWYFADWCSTTEEPDWWLNESIVTDSFTQVIILRDTTPPECTIEIGNQTQDTVAIICGTALPITFFTFDTCGTSGYEYDLDTLSNPPALRFFGGTFLPGKIRDTMHINALNVPVGRYRLTVTVFDHCNNSSTCVDTFVLICDVSQQNSMANGDVIHTVKPNPSRAMPENHQENDIFSPLDLSGNPLSEEKFELYQNRPNPFRSNTVIGFYLPNAEIARLKIYDIQGRLLKFVERRYPKGYNQVELTAMDLQMTGVLYYQLDTENFSATRRMIVTP